MASHEGCSLPVLMPLRALPVRSRFVGRGSRRISKASGPQCRPTLRSQPCRHAGLAALKLKHRRGGGKKRTGISLGELSAIWGYDGEGRLAELRGRNLEKDKYFGMELATVVLEGALRVEVAIGLRTDGSKQILDFATRSCECPEISHALIRRISDRGFRVEGRLFCILDGSASLEKALLRRWPEAMVQRCLCHVERDILKNLPRHDREEFHQLMTRLRWAQGPESGRQALKLLSDFAKSRDSLAPAELCKPGDQLIALHLLDVPVALNQALLSNLSIEKMIGNMWYFMGRAGPWRMKGGLRLIEPWLAAGLLSAEKKLNKIRGFRDLPVLFAALKALNLEREDGPSEAVLQDCLEDRQYSESALGSVPAFAAMRI